MKSIILLCFLLVSCATYAGEVRTAPGTEIVYDPKTGDYLEIVPDKDGLNISGKNLRTGKTWYRHNTNDGKVYGYTRDQELFYADRTLNTYLKFPALKSDFHY